ncbi:MAG: septum formation inhibitor Maf [Deltaproteobacteria bacterium]|nr:MAG: septum formation inhibitor Maf [Deltaproteobacteria bacterium]
MSRRLVLASASPRRRQLLGWLGVDFEVDPAAVDETQRPGEAPTDFVCRMATEKAKAVATRHPGAVVLAADTEVVLNGEALGKPGTRDRAAEMLSRLSGRTHQVLSAVAVGDGAALQTRLVRSEVRFSRLTPAAIAWYVETGEPLDKAGAYALQGRGAALVARVEGSPTGIIGLPLEETAALLAAAGVEVPWCR